MMSRFLSTLYHTCTHGQWTSGTASSWQLIYCRTWTNIPSTTPWTLCFRHSPNYQGRGYVHQKTNLLKPCIPLRLIDRRNASDKIPNDVSASKAFHPLHPTLIQRLSSLEESTRFQGYSTVRIGFGIVIIIGLGMYVFREYIRENVADEVSTVATMSLADTGVKMRVHELAVALIQTILNNPNIQNQSVQFLEDVFQNPATKEALISLLLHILNDPNAQKQLTATLKHIVQVSLSDEKFRQQLARNLRLLLRDDSTKRGLLELLSYVLSEESLKQETQRFFQEVLASKLVRDEASRLGKSTVRDVIGDDFIQKKTGDAMWTAFTYSVTPRVFGGRSPASQGTHGTGDSDTDTKGDRAIKDKEEKDTLENHL